MLILVKYKPVYKVTLLGQEIGIVRNKRNIEQAINTYTQDKKENVAFITIKDKPSFKLKFVDSMAKTNEQEVISKIENSSDITYRMYAIVLEGKQKAIVSTRQEAENVVDDIKKELNKDLELDLKIVETYDNCQTNVETVQVATARVNDDEIIKEKIKEKEATINGVVLKVPVTGVITSRFGRRRSGYHTGLDIANNQGTKIKATASGTVKYAGRRGSYGNLVIINHGNGVETYYAHCYKLLVNQGEKVEQGQTIALMGSTGNSTGPHLHLEVRLNGKTVNPQNYLYK